MNKIGQQDFCEVVKKKYPKELTLQEISKFMKQPKTTIMNIFFSIKKQIDKGSEKNIKYRVKHSGEKFDGKVVKFKLYLVKATKEN